MSTLKYIYEQITEPRDKAQRYSSPAAELFYFAQSAEMCAYVANSPYFMKKAFAIAQIDIFRWGYKKNVKDAQLQREYERACICIECNNICVFVSTDTQVQWICAEFIFSGHIKTCFIFCSHHIHSIVILLNSVITSEWVMVFLMFFFSCLKTNDSFFYLSDTNREFARRTKLLSL